MSIDVNTANGIWTCEKEEHSFDEPLAKEIVCILEARDLRCILDIGCGSGQYVEYIAHNMESWVVGIDGNPNTPKFSPFCFVGDATKPIGVGRGKNPPGTFDCVISLEVGEHIPKEFEQAFMENLQKNSHNLIILSWFPTEGHGIGHFNPRPNDYVKEQMLQRGFISDDMAQEDLREAATLWWFKESLMVFRRV